MAALGKNILIPEMYARLMSQQNTRIASGSQLYQPESECGQDGTVVALGTEHHGSTIMVYEVGYVLPPLVA